MRTVMYLLRHGATDANLTRPALIQGRNTTRRWPRWACARPN